MKLRRRHAAWIVLTSRWRRMAKCRLTQPDFTLSQKVKGASSTSAYLSACDDFGGKKEFGGAL